MSTLFPRCWTKSVCAQTRYDVVCIRSSAQDGIGTSLYKHVYYCMRFRKGCYLLKKHLTCETGESYELFAKAELCSMQISAPPEPFVNTVFQESTCQTLAGRATEEFSCLGSGKCHPELRICLQRRWLPASPLHLHPINPCNLPFVFFCRHSSSSVFQTQPQQPHVTFSLLALLRRRILPVWLAVHQSILCLFS